MTMSEEQCQMTVNDEKKLIIDTNLIKDGERSTNQETEIGRTGKLK